MSEIILLNLEGFRNHHASSLGFGNGLNFIFGGNAQGKTNILESIYLLIKGKSFRTNDHREMISWGRDFGRIEASVKKKGGFSSATAMINEKEKTFRLDGKGVRKRADMGVVLFVPEETMLFKGAPQLRREYFDGFFGDLDGLYRAICGEYYRVLRARNALLKGIAESDRDDVATEMEVWDTRLVETGTDLIIKRMEWSSRINGELPGMYTIMGGVGSGAQLVYLCSLAGEGLDRNRVRAAFIQKLGERREIEILSGSTVVGPHRDDWTALIAGRDIRAFGSQGQMRVMVLGLKAVEFKMKGEKYDEPPVVLLDDVLSELDAPSADRLLKFIGELNGQVIITSTEKIEDLNGIGPNHKEFRIVSGEVFNL